MGGTWSERAPRDGEVCECGRPAVVVYVTERGDVPHCGIGDGAAPGSYVAGTYERKPEQSS